MILGCGVLTFKTSQLGTSPPELIRQKWPLLKSSFGFGAYQWYWPKGNRLFKFFLCRSKGPMYNYCCLLTGGANILQ